MSEGTAAALGATAGLTVFLGLPIAKARVLPRWAQLFANAVATGAVLFLFVDIMSRALQPVEGAVEQARTTGGSSFLQLLALLATGVAVGLMSLIHFDGRILGAFRTRVALPPATALSVDCDRLGLTQLLGRPGHRAVRSHRPGYGGLARDRLCPSQSNGGVRDRGTLGLGIRLTVVGFLGLAGLVCGGPTTLATMIGLVAPAPYLQVLFLALAARALIYVLQELFHLLRKSSSREVMGWGILTGFLVPTFGDLLLIYVGAYAWHGRSRRSN